ncbi:MAG: hypothetical protein V3V08_23550 [Nannocystaceae bacterium]
MKHLSLYLDMSSEQERHLYAAACVVEFRPKPEHARRGPIFEPGHPDDVGPDDGRIANRMTRSMDAHWGGVVW